MNSTNKNANQTATEQRGRSGEPGRPKKDQSSERDQTGRFLPGASGNPQGKPLGSRNYASVLVENLLDGQAQALAQKAIEMALAGHVLALRLCLERLAPARKERHMVLELPAPETAQGISAGFAKVVEALTQGELTPTETKCAAELLEAARRALETTDLARRIEEIEQRLPARAGK